MKIVCNNRAEFIRANKAVCEIMMIARRTDQSCRCMGIWVDSLGHPIVDEGRGFLFLRLSDPSPTATGLHCIVWHEGSEREIKPVPSEKEGYSWIEFTLS